MTSDLIVSILGSAAALCALVFAWALAAELTLLALLLFCERLDFSDKSPLRLATEYTLVVLVVAGTGALVLGGVAGLWALIASLADSAPAGLASSAGKGVIG